MPIRYVPCMEGCQRHIMARGGEEGENNQSDFKPIQVSLRLNTSIFQLLNLLPPLPITLEIAHLRGLVIYFVHHPAFERSIKLMGSLWREADSLSFVFHKQPWWLVVPFGRPNPYKDSSYPLVPMQSFCQHHFLDKELLKFLICCKKCFLSPKAMR